MQKIETMNLKFIIRKNRAVEGKAPIQMQITIDGERIIFTTNQKIEIENWEEKTGRAIGKTPRIKVLNELLDKMNVDAHKAFNEMKHLDEEINGDSLRKKLLGEEKYSRKKIFELTQIYNAHTAKLIGIELNKHTWERYKAYANKLAEFIKIKYHIDDISIHQLKYNFILEYDFYLKTEVKLHQRILGKDVRFGYCIWLSRIEYWYQAAQGFYIQSNSILLNHYGEILLCKALSGLGRKIGQFWAYNIVLVRLGGSRL